MDSRQRRQIILARQRLTAPADPEAVWRGAGEPAKDAPGETEL